MKGGWTLFAERLEGSRAPKGDGRLVFGRLKRGRKLVGERLKGG